MFFVATLLTILVTLECHGEPNTRQNVTSWVRTTQSPTTAASHVVRFPSLDSDTQSYLIHDLLGLRTESTLRPQNAPTRAPQVDVNCNCSRKKGESTPNPQSTTVIPTDAEVQNSSDTKPDTADLINSQLRQFGLNLLIQLSESDSTSNLILSPFSVWAVLLMILEGARGSTAEQIRTTLHLPPDAAKIRSNFKYIEGGLVEAKGTADFDSVSALFFDQNRPLNEKYRNTVEHSYHAEVHSVDFTKPAQSVRKINAWVANKTHNRITRLIQAGDLARPELLVTNAIYFKGLWEMPFNSTATAKAKFFNEENNHIANVDMMYQKGTYLYSFIQELKSHVLDMPYKGYKFRMLIILPEVGNTLLNVYRAMKRFPVDECYKRLLEEQEMYADSEVPVFLPRFKVKNDRTLNRFLQNLGIQDLFDTENADLSGMTRSKIYLNKMIHIAEIEVNEKGTTASGATGALFGNKQSPPKFVANRPFAFFIVEDSKKTVIFAGRVLNPNKND